MLIFNRTGTYLATLDKGGMSIRSTKDWKPIRTSLCGIRAVAIEQTQVAYGRTLRNSEAVGLMSLEDTERSSEWASPSNKPVNTLVFSPDGRWLVAGTDDGKAWGWSLEGPGYGRTTYSIPSLHHTGISQLAYLPDPEGRSRYLFLTADRDGVLAICRGNFAGARSEYSKPQCGMVMDLPSGIRRLDSVGDQVIIGADHVYSMDLSYKTMFDRVDELSWCKGTHHGVCP